MNLFSLLVKVLAHGQLFCWCVLKAFRIYCGMQYVIMYVICIKRSCINQSNIQNSKKHYFSLDNYLYLNKCFETEFELDTGQIPVNAILSLVGTAIKDFQIVKHLPKFAESHKKFYCTSTCSELVTLVWCMETLPITHPMSKWYIPWYLLAFLYSLCSFCLT